jgi:uncharacterized membrane protein
MSESEARAGNWPTNLGAGERTLSIAVGGALLWRALGGPVLGPLVLTLGGATLIWRGLNGFCPVKERLQSGQSEPETAGPYSVAKSVRRRAGRSDPVQQASEDSFPASDPPSWTPTNGPARRH